MEDFCLRVKTNESDSRTQVNLLTRLGFYIMLLHRLSYTMKTQLKATNSPYEGHFMQNITKYRL